MSAIISFIATPITTLLIIPEQFGKASMFTLAYGLLIQIVFLGTHQSFVRFFYERETSERQSMLWQSLLCPLLIYTIILSLMLCFWRNFSLLLLGGVISFFPVLVLALNLLVGMLEYYATLILRMEKRGLAFSASKIINSSTSVLGLIAYTYLANNTYEAVIVGSLLGNLVSLTISILLTKKYWLFHFNYLKIDKIKDIISYGLPFLPTFLVAWVFTSLDKIALRQFSSFQEIGLYAAAFKLVAILGLFQAAFTMFWNPHAYEEYERSPQSTELFSMMFTVVSFVMLIVAGVAILFKDFVILILAKSYREAANIMPFLIFQPLMYTASEVTVCGINFKKRTHWHLWISVACALLNLLGNTLLVPTYGARGAAFSTGMSYILFFFLRTWISQQCYLVPYKLKKFYLLTGLVSVQAFIGTFSRVPSYSLITSIFVISAIFLSYKEELLALKKAFRRKEPTSTATQGS